MCELAWIELYGELIKSPVFGWGSKQLKKAWNCGKPKQKVETWLLRVDLASFGGRSYWSWSLLGMMCLAEAALSRFLFLLGWESRWILFIYSYLSFLDSRYKDLGELFCHLLFCVFAAFPVRCVDFVWSTQLWSFTQGAISTTEDMLRCPIRWIRSSIISQSTHKSWDFPVFFGGLTHIARCSKAAAKAMEPKKSTNVAWLDLMDVAQGLPVIHHKKGVLMSTEFGFPAVLTRHSLPA